MELDQNQNWEQFSIEVGPEEAELIALLLSEILPGSVVEEKNYGDLFPQELADYRGPVRLYGYYPAEDGHRIREEIKSALKAAGSPSQPEFTDLVPEDWATVWQERYQPVPVGERLIVVPSWLDNPYPDRLAVYMDPGMAFGSGTHPTTQLSLELLEDCVTEMRPKRLIDVGCGSGILAIAGARLGVEQVLGVDTDPDAVRISCENAAANSVSRVTSFKHGSVPEILTGTTPFQNSPLVVANIIATVLEELFEQDLGQLVSEDGRLLLCGILETQAPGIRKLLTHSGFQLREERQLGEWIGLVGEKVEY
jgi:ribosomal protein L11 methyltransferase